MRATLIFLAAGAALLPVAFPAQAAETGDTVRGGRLFLQCQACHTVAPGAAHSVGPNLAGVMGSKAASRPGYAYSDALLKSGIRWTPTTMNAWLTRPSTVVPGTKMAFAGVADAKARADLIAYLGTLKGGK